MVRRFWFIYLVLISVIGVYAQPALPTAPRGTVSASYCYGFDTFNYINLDLTYYIYYLTFAGYPISYLNVFGGVSYKFDNTETYTEFGYQIGASFNFLFATVRPTYRDGYMLYRNYDSCYAYGGVNYPLLWASSAGGTNGR